ncbi:MAG: LysR substrate-binding domain-containing protein [Burkholderiales bacterium]
MRSPGAPGTPGTIHRNGFVAYLCAGATDVEVRIVGGISVTLLPLLREGRIDFALGEIPPDLKDKQIRTFPLWRNERVIVGRRGHPLCNAKSLNELAGADWIIRSGSEEIPRGSPGQMVADLFVANGLAPPRSVVRCGDSGLFLSLLAQSDMLSTMDLLQLNSPIIRDHLQPINLKAGKEKFAAIPA